MSEQPMDEFDARLAGLMTAYGDRAVLTYDAGLIARRAFDGRPARRPGFAELLTPRRRAALLLGALALLALAAIVFVGSRPPSPIGDAFASPIALAWSPDGQTLAIVVDVADAGSDGGASASSVPGAVPVGRDGRPSHPELWVVNGDDGTPRHLATLHSATGVSAPVWTHDGRSVLVAVDSSIGGIAHSAIQSIGLDGSEPTTLAETGAGGISIRGLSPEGGRLLYLGSDTSGTDLYVLDLAGGTSSRLTTSGTVCCSGTWSPDGRWILYTDSVPGGTNADDYTTRVVAADGSETHRIGPCCDVGWSPDGPRAYFEAYGEPLYSAGPDGTDVRAETGGEAPYGWVPSPDGRRFIAVTDKGLAILRPGEPSVPLTTDPGDRGPTWSPDGSWIAFSGIRWGVSGVYAVRATGGEPWLVAPDVLVNDDPWRPGAGRVELTLIRDRGIIVVSPDGTGLRELVPRTTIAGDPRARPDGSAQQSVIVIGPDGPDQDTYQFAARDPSVRVENRSTVAWIPWNLVEKDFDCIRVSGPAVPSKPCTVAPGATVSFLVPPPLLGTTMQIQVAPVGVDYRRGYPVTIDWVEAP